MTVITAMYRFQTGEKVGVTVELENDYPDCLAEGVKTIGRAMREVITTVSEDDE